MNRSISSAAQRVASAGALALLAGACAGPTGTPGADLGSAPPDARLHTTPPAAVTSAWAYEHPRPAGSTLRAAWTSGADTIAVGALGTIVKLSTGSAVREAPGLTLATLRALAGSEDDLWAVGDDGMVLHRSAGKWSAERLGPGNLRAVWTRGDDVFVAGQGPRLWQRTKEGWSAGTLPGQGDTAVIESAVTVGEDTYLVGTGGRILHYAATARRWFIEADALSRVPYYAVTADETGAVYAVGAAGRIVRRDPGSGTWQSEAPADPPLTRDDLRAVFAVRGTVFALAESGTVLRRSGGAWQPGAPLPGPGRVYGGTASLTGAVAVGEAGQVWSRGADATTPWTSALPSPPLTTQGVTALAGTADGGVLAVTEDGQILARSAAGTWSVEFQLPAAQRQPLYGVWAAPAAAPGDVDAYSVGFSGSLWQRSGGAWSAAVYPKVGTRPDFRGVWAQGSGATREAFVVGSTVNNVGETIAVVLRYGGGAWLPDGPAPAVSESLYAVGPAGSDVLTIGTRGTILRRSGTTWLREAPGRFEDAALYALAGTSARTYVVGTRGTILVREGSGPDAVWTRTLLADGSQNLTGIALGGGGLELWVGGTGSAVWHRAADGRTWTREQTLAETSLAGLVRVGGTLLAGGSGGAILQRPVTP